MSGLNGDFLGFTFIINGKPYTSQELGITRVSDGDRYNEPLIPEIEDKTIEIPGLDGTYFYGSDFKTRNFSIKIAFDSMTEENFRTMRQIFGYKHTGELIFNEWPYKKYLVKVASPPELEYVCFDEQEREILPESATGVRVVDRRTVSVDVPYEKTITVKEGIIEVVPFLERPATITVEYDGRELSVDAPEEEREVFYDAETGELGIYIDGIEDGTELTVIIRFTLPGTEIQITRETIKPYGDYTGEKQRIYKGEGTIEFIAYYPFAKMVTKFADEYDNENKNEWLSVSGLKNSTWFDNGDVDKYVDGVINVYNPGDVETGFKLFIPFDANGTIPTFTLTYKDQVLNISEITRKEEDVIVEGNTEPGSIGVQINTNNGLIEGIWKRSDQNNQGINDMFVTSGQIYNECATGEFFKIQPSNQKQQIGITIDPGNIEIYYDYLYF